MTLILPLQQTHPPLEYQKAGVWVPDAPTPNQQGRKPARGGPELTVFDLDIFEGQLRPRIADQHFSIEGEHDVIVDEVYHAADHVAWLPGATERLTAYVPALALERGRGGERSIHGRWKWGVHRVRNTGKHGRREASRLGGHQPVSSNSPGAH